MGWRDSGGRAELLSWGFRLVVLLLGVLPSTVLSGAAPAVGVLGSAEASPGKSVGVNDGPTDTGSVGRGEGLASETNEEADNRYTSVTSSTVLGMTLEKEGETAV